MIKAKYLIVIMGPTAVGKTSLAIEIAKSFHTEILSADARQFYREMSIGTAKPTNEELSSVKHHFVNNLSIQDSYTAGIYEEEALTLLDRLFKEKDVVVMVGGSGLFIKTIVDGMDDIPSVEPIYREQLNLEFKNDGLIHLLDELQEKDPIYYNEVDKANPMRVIRALEVCRATGNPFSSFRKAEKKERPFHVLKVGLSRDREELYNRIEERIEEMLRLGLVDEAKSLIKYKDCNALQTVGYKEVFGYLEGVGQ